MSMEKHTKWTYMTEFKITETQRPKGSQSIQKKNHTNKN